MLILFALLAGDWIEFAGVYIRVAWAVVLFVGSLSHN